MTVNGESRLAWIANQVIIASIAAISLLAVAGFGMAIFWMLEPAFTFGPHPPLPHDGTGTTYETLRERRVWPPGATVPIWFEYCNPKALAGDPMVRQSLIDDRVIALPSYPAVPEGAGCHARTFYLKLPDDLPEGTWYLRNAVHYQVNPLRQAIVISPDVKLIIKR